MENDVKIFDVLQVARQAGALIMEIYETDFDVEYKDDESPLTLADQKANQHIVTCLKKLTPDVPVLSEESRSIPFDERRDWDEFWLVDPVDGTKEFIKKNGEFTVNIALVKNQTPHFGVVYVPAKDELYFASDELGSYKIVETHRIDQCKTIEEVCELSQPLPADHDREIYTVVGSRSHMSSETEDFINSRRRKYGDVELISAGSSLKFCLVAEGLADVYPRFAPTMEWDTGAGHAIALGAGCKVINPETGESLRYNKENLLNPWFVVEAE